MGLFPQKVKTQEVTYIDKLVVVIGGNKFHRHDHEIQELKNLILSNEKKLDKILKVLEVGGEDAILRQQIFDTLTKVKSDLESTV